MISNYPYLILGMTLATYLPRMLPVLFLEKIHFSPRTEKFLHLIPYTAMTALIFPGILYTDPDHMIVGLAGGLTALVLAWKKMPVMVCVLGAIAMDYILYLFL